MVIVLLSCVMVQVTLSAPCIRGLRPWLLALSRVQVPARLAGAAACTTNVNMSALDRLKAPTNFLIQDLLQKLFSFSKLRRRRLTEGRVFGSSYLRPA